MQFFICLVNQSRGFEAIKEEEEENERRLEFQHDGLHTFRNAGVVVDCSAMERSAESNRGDFAKFD
ncbi:hypothetical protein YC2023_020234 [Brassica napus]